MSDQDSSESFREKYFEQLKINRELTGQELSVEARLVINALDAARDWVLPEAITPIINVSVQRADFLLGRLVESRHADASMICPTSYRITQKGRMAVHGTSA